MLLASRTSESKNLLVLLQIDSPTGLALMEGGRGVAAAA